MKEESLKKIMQKSTLETSDDFINNLMDTIEVSKQQQKIRFWNSYKFTLITTLILIIPATGLLFRLLRQESAVLSIFKNIPITPMFVAITLLLLYMINTIIKLQETSKNV
ncbi:hypothetical protein GCM10011344_11210 [Dokdonia pacifica]|uniref:Uncharacterized protein n=1 Tax=Dokdonia pacifica TaxID=1627892 RepID=A0A238YH92_9FLAO|nr:hypothetical protein [Dokdonia pacifica]GGG12255.1 hypothetical protein GCM10011344_11210 [Dokdonia pacifica]SNR70565.1 hypothetical protein SAMN06265376_10273 [Dokdonia pacifica]